MGDALLVGPSEPVLPLSLGSIESESTLSGVVFGVDDGVMRIGDGWAIDEDEGGVVSMFLGEGSSLCGGALSRSMTILELVPPLPPNLCLLLLLSSCIDPPDKERAGDGGGSRDECVLEGTGDTDISIGVGISSLRLVEENDGSMDGGVDTPPCTSTTDESSLRKDVDADTVAKDVGMLLLLYGENVRPRQISSKLLLLLLVIRLGVPTRQSSDTSIKSSRLDFDFTRSIRCGVLLLERSRSNDEELPPMPADNN
ncbi:hypothetical protein SAMD00019534_023380 [Acytostelium subglobosum LB1]|uniref:hypothetical protein n=1 Tax=Acytostelium subglobosum LB1 TaxID=1410327 RepID=UPI000644E262|nr:hypothetical protein SAMD00019534_023380 [Acytostelium subglobosum LB1]GAM19163.1 hypothetical protein SAMD00019534_023380 [Acytostelium subglobosum LB1]|eukprot:XP_012757090.1 hypothetical protein SAMD00019534_023380 [Acytostelium subglobosum LB1]